MLQPHVLRVTATCVTYYSHTCYALQPHVLRVTCYSYMCYMFQLPVLHVAATRVTIMKQLCVNILVRVGNNSQKLIKSWYFSTIQLIFFTANDIILLQLIFFYYNRYFFTTDILLIQLPFFYYRWSVFSLQTQMNRPSYLKANPSANLLIAEHSNLCCSSAELNYSCSLYFAMIFYPSWGVHSIGLKLSGDDALTSSDAPSIPLEMMHLPQGMPRPSRWRWCTYLKGCFALPVGDDALTSRDASPFSHEMMH